MQALQARIDELCREQEEQQRLMAAAGVGIWTWDVATDRLEWTPGLKQMFAAAPTAIADVLALVHPDDRADIARQVEEVLSGHRTGVGAIYRYLRTDGRLVWADTRGEAVHEEAGRVTRMRGTMVDVTARKAVEAALRTSEARLEAIIENTPNVAVYGYDRDERIVLWNRAAERMFGWSAEGAMGKRLDELFPSEEVAARRAPVTPERSPAPAGPYERTSTRRDGTTLVCLSTTFGIPGPGENVSVCMDVDITDRKRAEAELLQAAKVESIGRLAGGVAHDFNNMLTAILGYAELLERAVPTSGEAAEAIRELRRAAERGAHLTGQLLAYGRRHVVEPRSVDVNVAVLGVLGLLRRLIGENIEIATSLAPDAGFVRIDPSQLEQVLVNLAVNARDAMPAGGIITITTGRRTDGRVCIAVTDTGHGIAPEVLPHVFEPFFTTKPQGAGTGLGLATCERIVGDAGGSIAVVSTQGRGSTFEVLLPFERAGEAPPAETSRFGIPRGHETVLLVEDDRAIRALVERALTTSGYRVLVAENGAAALELGERDGLPQIDVLVTDLVMPKMGGQELARRLRQGRPDLAVLFTSGYTDRGVANDTDAARARTRYLQKPFRMAELGSELRRLIDDA